MKTADSRPLLVRATIVACLFVLLSLLSFTGVHAQDQSWPEPLTPLLPTWSALNRPDWSPSSPAVIAAAQAEVAAAQAGVAAAQAESAAINADEVALNPTWVRTAFISWQDGNPEVYSADSNGRNQVRLTASAQAEARPRVSSDGAWIAYDVDNYATGGREIMRVGFGGGTPEIIVDSPDPAVRDMAPAWSPDGKYLAFVSTRDGNAEIYLLILETMQLWRVTYNGLADFDPSWNPATGELVWARQMDSVYGVVMAALVGGGEHRVSDYITNLETPFFDVTGTMLAYTAAMQPGGPSQVFVRHNDSVNWVSQPDALPDYMKMFFRLDAFYTRAQPDYEDSPQSIQTVTHLFITRYVLWHDGRQWLLAEAEVTSPGFNLGDAPTMDGDAVVLDQIAPELTIAVPPGEGKREQITPPIFYSDKGGAGVVAVEYTYKADSGDQPYPQFLLPPDQTPYFSTCGNTTLNAQATDAAGHKTPWASVSTLVVGSTRTIKMQEVGGAPVKGVEVTSSEGGYIPEEETSFGHQVSDAAGLIHYRTCGDNGYWFWPPSTKWERFDESEYYGGDGLVLLSKTGQVKLTKEYPPPAAAGAAHAQDAANAEDDERILIYRATGTVNPDQVSENLWLAIWYGADNAAQSPMQITLQSAATVTPTILLEKQPRAAQVEYFYLPLGQGLSGPITLTVSIEARPGVDGSNIGIGDARIASQWLPIVRRFEPVAPTNALEVAATQTYTIAGDNFMQPLKASLGVVESSALEWIDAQTLLATFPTDLPAGMLSLVVTNRAGTPNAASTELAGVLASQVRAWMPFLQTRATPFR